MQQFGFHSWVGTHRQSQCPMRPRQPPSSLNQFTPQRAELCEVPQWRTPFGSAALLLVGQHLHFPDEVMWDFAWMVRRHEDDILNYFRMPINNGTVEGLNNKAKLVIHKDYGFRTAKNYIRNLYHCLGNLPLPQTVHTFV